MMNYLRADLYRLWKSKTLLCCAALTLFVPVALLAFCYIDQAAIFGPPNPDVRLGDSYLHMAACMGFGACLLPVACSYPGVYLITKDFKEGTFKTMLVGRHARLRYMTAKIVLAAILPVALAAFSLAAYAVLPYLGPAAYYEQVSASVALTWLPFAMVVCFGYCAICNLLAFLFKNETLVWFASCGVIFGIIDNAAAMVLAWVSVVVSPAVSSAFLVAMNALMITSKNAVAWYKELIALDGWAFASVALIPLGWAAASAALSYLRFRRQAL